LLRLLLWCNRPILPAARRRYGMLPRRRLRVTAVLLRRWLLLLLLLLLLHVASLWLHPTCCRLHVPTGGR
jgi:hypothetical protein